MLKSIPQRDYWLHRTQQILDISFDEIDSEQALKHNRNVQLCLLIASTAYADHLIKKGVLPQMLCGLSIGAYPAAVIAKALSFEDALRLVARRGDLMEAAYPRHFGMTAILGMSLTEVTELCKEFNDVFVANYNAQNQIVVSGADCSMKLLAQKALQQGALRATRLHVSVPSHCSLLDAAAQQLSDFFKQIPIKRPEITYLSGSTGRVLYQPEAIKTDLALNMARMTRWHDAMLNAYERGFRLAIEMPPGSVLTQLTRTIFTEGEVVSLTQTGVAYASDLYYLRNSNGSSF